MHRFAAPLMILGFLLLTSPLFAASLEQQVQNNSDRIEELERLVEDLRTRLDGAEPAEAIEARLTPVGIWQCGNGVLSYKIIFEQNGQMIQQEPTFGNAREMRWRMTGPKEMMLTGSTTSSYEADRRGNTLEIDFDSQGDMLVRDNSSGARWDCSRN